MKKYNLYKKLKRFDTLVSTNDYAVDLAKSEKPVEGTVIMADYQTKGKGQKDTYWISEKGSNLTFSILLYPSFLVPASNFFLSMVLSLGIVDMLLSYNIVTKIKWPNDIFTSNGKIAGILIENAIQNDKIKYSVLGTGLNVNQEIFPENISNPTSMMIEQKGLLNREDVLKKLLESIEYWIYKLYNQDFNIIKDQYEQQLLYRNQLKEFYAGDDIFAGTIKGINETGQLLIADKSNSVRAYNFKEVMYYQKKT